MAGCYHDRICIAHPEHVSFVSAVNANTDGVSRRHPAGMYNSSSNGITDSCSPSAGGDIDKCNCS